MRYAKSSYDNLIASWPHSCLPGGSDNRQSLSKCLKFTFAELRPEQGSLRVVSLAWPGLPVHLGTPIRPGVEGEVNRLGPQPSKSQRSGKN